jgi:excisionase family DNA binding protein
MDRVTVAEAAERLGVSQDAVYKRIKRGTIPWDKDEDGKTVVYVEESNGSTGNSKSSTDESTDRLKTFTDNPGSSSIDVSVDVLVDELRDRVSFLEEELRRKDTILMSLVQRVPELEAPPEQRESHQAGVRHKKIMLLRKSRPGGGASLAMNSRRPIALVSRPLVVRKAG